MKKQKKVQVVVWLWVVGLSILSFSCSNTETSVTQDPYVPFVTPYTNQELDENSSMAKAFGDFDLFAPQIVAHDHNSQDSDIAKITNTIEDFKTFQQKNLSRGALREPPVSVEAIEYLTKCPVPQLNTTKPTLTDSIEWQIFANCVLGLAPSDVNGNLRYPPISKMDNFFSAFSFLHKAKIAYRNKYFPLVVQSTLTQEQQYALFEKLFLVAKFRLPTPAEKKIAKGTIEALGVSFLSDAFLFNWFFSSFYADHFNFQKNPSPSYESITVSGSLQDAQGNPLEGVFYAVQGVPLDSQKEPIQVYGFQPQALSQKISNKNNFHVQFYVPTKIYFPNKNNIFSPNRHLPKPFTVSLLSVKDGYKPKVTTVAVSKSDTHDVVISLEKMSGQEAELSWPQVNLSPKNPFLAMDFTPTFNGSLGTCERPTKQDSEVLDGYAWQHFSHCLLQFSAFHSQFGIHYYPLVTKQSAFDFVFATKEKYLKSDRGVGLTDLQVLVNLYTLLTLKPPTAVSLDSMTKSLDTLGLPRAVNQLLEAWFHSTAYTKFYDYSKESFEAKTWVHLSGEISDKNGKALANVNISVENAYGRAFHQTLKNESDVFMSDVSGKFSLPLLIPNRELSMPIVLTAKGEGYAPQTHVLAELEQKQNIFAEVIDQTKDFTLIPLNLATLAEGGLLQMPSAEASIQVPAGAVTNDTTFTMSNFSFVSLSTQTPNEKTTITGEFTVTPSYQFKKPVTIEIKITDKLRNSLKAKENNLALFVKESDGKLTLLEDSDYSPAKGVLKATTTHFSTFVIGQCGLIDCGGPADVHPLASVLERQQIEYPTQLPQLKREAVALLEAGGWSASAVDSVKNTTLSGCDEKSCPPTEVSLSQEELQVPTSYHNNQVDIESIEVVSSKLTVTTNLDVQAEQCAINPKASIPQIRINSIDSTNANINVLLKFNNVKISYPCIKKKYFCFLFCIPYPSRGTCHEPTFDHYAHYTLGGYSQSVLKDSSKASKWRAGPTFSGGLSNVSIPDYVKTSKIKRIYAQELESVLKEKVSFSKSAITQRVNHYVNTEFGNDPEFTASNCFEAGDPVATVQSFSNGNILSDIGGTLPNGTAIPAETTLHWQSSRDGHFTFRVNTVNADCTTGTPLAGTGYSGTVVKSKPNNAVISASQLPANGSNGLHICITDKYNGITGGTNVLLRKVWMDKVCVIKPTMVRTCKMVPIRTCHMEYAGSHRTHGCWFRVGKRDDCYFWCHIGNRCHTSYYKEVCTTKNEEQCVDETKNIETCTDELRY